MAIPGFQAFMLPILEITNELELDGETEIKFREIFKLLANRLELTEEEQEELLPSGIDRIYTNRAGWAKFHLKKAGLIETPKRGFLFLTDRARELLKSKPEKVSIQDLVQFAEYREFKEASKRSKSDEKTTENGDSKDLTPEERMEDAEQEIQAILAQELLEKILNESPDFFEDLIVKLLVSMGYGGSQRDAGKAIGKSGDNGVDGVISQDALGLDRVYIQAKRYALGNNVTPNDVNSFAGSLGLHKSSKGVFVTTSGFSKTALENVEKMQNNIVLIDGKRLTELMILHNMGCKIEKTLHIKEIDEDFFE